MQWHEHDFEPVPAEIGAAKVAEVSDEVGSLCQGIPAFKVTKVAEALDEVDAYDPRTVVRVNGLRALGDGGISIVAQYFNDHFGSVKREVPVICQGSRGKAKPTNFGFIVMSCTAEAEQILARNTLIVDQHTITVREYAVKHHERDSCQAVPEFKATEAAEAVPEFKATKAAEAVPEFKATKAAEALNEADAHAAKTVRVKGLRAFGDGGLSVVASYLRKHFGPVKREVPVICHDVHGQHMPSNFGFIVMRCTAGSEQILEHSTHIVDGHQVMFRVYVHKSKEGDQQRPKERSNLMGVPSATGLDLKARPPRPPQSQAGRPGCAVGYRRLVQVPKKPNI
jgi:hypothetical protein